jgi:hypothetical protein
VPRAIRGLGDVAHLSVPGYYQSVWQHILFAAPGDPVLSIEKPVLCSVARNGKIAARKIRVDAALGEKTRGQLERIRSVLAALENRSGAADVLGVLPYWLFATDTMILAARKLAVLGPGGGDTPEARRSLKREMTSLAGRFERLWMARNRRSEIGITLKRYRRAIASLARA